MRILIIDDDIKIQGLIGYFFKKNGFKVEMASDGLDGLKLLKKIKAEIVIIDIKVPSLDGKNFIKIVRDLPHEYGDPVIIMTSSETEIEDVLTALEIGANDFIKKPFDPRELILRTEKLLTGGSKNNKKYTFKNVIIDDKKHLVTEKGIEVELSKKEYDLLLFLFKNQEVVLSREKILDKVWNTIYHDGDRSVDIYIYKLREKIKSISKCIKTVKGVGYKIRVI